MEFGQVHNTRSSWQMSTATANVESLRPGDPISMEQHVHTLENPYNMSTAEDIVYIEGRSTSLTLWFSGPRQAGNFVTHC
jgi:hypothetical protein